MPFQPAATPLPASGPSRRPFFRWAGLLLLAAALLYGPFLWSPLVFDDMYFFDGKAPAAAGALFDFGRRWFAYASFGWTWNGLGQDLIWFRLGNLLLHGGVGIALFALLRQLFAAAPLPSFGFRSDSTLSPDAWAFCCALLFLLHPVSVYAVAYLTQRSTVMATLGAWLTLLFHWRGLTTGKTKWFAAAVAGYFFALFSKEHAIMVPAVALALTALLPAGAARRIPWGAFLAYGIIAGFMVLKIKGLLGASYEPFAQGMLEAMPGAPSGNPYAASIATQATLFFKYLGLWMFPYPYWMSVDMREPLAPSLLAWPYVAGLAGFVAFGVTAMGLLLRTEKLRLLGFALLFPWLLFATELAAVRIQEPFVLYRGYLWMGGALAALPWILAPLGAVRSRWVVGIAAALLALAAADRLRTFSHPLLLWDDAAILAQRRANPPGTERILYNRGVEYQRLRRFDEALADYDAAFKINSKDGHIHHNRAVVLAELGRHPEALAEFDAALGLLPDNRKSYLGRGISRLALGDRPGARQDFRTACQLEMPTACDRYRELGGQ